MSASSLQTIFVVCEGATEETFVSQILAPAFYPLGKNLITQTINTSSKQKGGALTYDRVKNHLLNTLKGDNKPVVTTLIDLYGLDTDFPGYSKPGQLTLDQRLQNLNREFQQDIIQAAGCRPEQFLPYIQPYEFEALLFSDITILTEHNSAWKRSASALESILQNVDSPEHINDRPETKPAALLDFHLKNPGFRKTLDGIPIAEKITLTRIRSKCAYFNQWLTDLEAIFPFRLQPV